MTELPSEHICLFVFGPDDEKWDKRGILVFTNHFNFLVQPLFLGQRPRRRRKPIVRFLRVYHYNPSDVFIMFITTVHMIGEQHHYPYIEKCITSGVCYT